MKNLKESIRKMIEKLNSPENEGGFWLPNIQRPFVWPEEKVEKLFDSVMRNYPISAMLIWKTTSTIKSRKFIDYYRDGIKLTDFYIAENSARKNLVLDGQQRLQAFYIALKGSYNRKELYFNILTGEKENKDGVKYVFEFRESDQDFPWIKVKDIVYTTKDYSEYADELSESLDKDQAKVVRKNVSRIQKIFCTEEVVIYQELDSIDDPQTYSVDDIVEIFIRANSGGTPLQKSDLLFALLSASWDEAEENIESLLEEINKTGYEFNRDLILKACLCMLDKGAKYEVDKFRNTTTKDKIASEWNGIETAIKDVKDFVYGKTFARGSKSLTSYNALIPIFYFAYNFNPKWKSEKIKPGSKIQKYLERALITGFFGSHSDNAIDECVKKIKESSDFDPDTLLKGALIDKDKVMVLDYTEPKVHLLFSLWYGGMNYNPCLDNNLPQVDHIFPQSLLKSVKFNDPASGRKTMKYKKYDRDQLANLMLLTAHENGSGQKWDASPEEWFDGKDEAYLDLHLIPKDKSLWKLENFEKFIEARKELIYNKFKYLFQ